jgi:hypothetical protein
MWRKTFVLTTEAALDEMRFQCIVQALKRGESGLSSKADPQDAWIPFVRKCSRQTGRQLELVGGRGRGTSRCLNQPELFFRDLAQESQGNVQQVGGNPFGGFRWRSEACL